MESVFALFCGFSTFSLLATEWHIKRKKYAKGQTLIRNNLQGWPQVYYSSIEWEHVLIHILCMYTNALYCDSAIPYKNFEQLSAWVGVVFQSVKG